MIEATIEILPSVGQRIDSLSFADLRREARDWYDKSAYWKSQFEITKEREKKKDERINELEAEIRLWKQKFFGKKSEAKKKADKVKDDSSKEPPELPKSRGQQPGSPGHGRRDYNELDSIDEKNDLEEHEKLCACCGLPFEDKGLTHTTKIVEIEIKAHKRIITTPQYHKGCTCPETPAMIAAPPADRLIKGNNLGVSVWTELLLSKFCLHVPLSRILKLYSIHDFNLPVGTVTDGFRRIQPLFAPIVESIKNISLQDDHWHADETRWSVFVAIEGKAGHRWYLWVYRSQSCVYFQLEPSRGAKVPKDFFPEEIIGILSVDRYSAYKNLVKSRKGLTLAFCWVHVRRDFIEAHKKWPHHEKWTLSWLSDISEMFKLNSQRINEEVGTDAWSDADASIRAHMFAMKEKYQKELLSDTLESEPKKVLKSLNNHWDGLTVFLDNPHVPLDNNPAEQSVRGPVVGRKNYYGSGSRWSANLASDLFSIFSTLELRGINQEQWLHSYLSACAAAGGKPPDDISQFTPWAHGKQEKVLDLADTKSVPGFP